MEEAQGEKVRTFISIEITEDIRKKLETLTKELDQYGAKPVAKENMHITLFFLGDINSTALDETKKILAEINAVKFYASVRGIGTFSSKMPSVIFAKVEEGKDAIGSIYKTLFKKLKTINVKIDSRDYHPHITIARARHKCDKKQLLEFIDRNSDTEFGRFLCSEIKIKSSVLTNDGPIYTNLYTKALD